MTPGRVRRRAPAPPGCAGVGRARLRPVRGDPDARPARPRREAGVLPAARGGAREPRGLGAVRAPRGLPGGARPVPRRRADPSQQRRFASICSRSTPPGRRSPSPRTTPAASSHPTPPPELANDLATVSVQQPDGSFEREAGPLRRAAAAAGGVPEAVGRAPARCSHDRRGAPAGVRRRRRRAGRVLRRQRRRDRRAEMSRPSARLREWFGERLITPGGIRGQVLREQDSEREASTTTRSTASSTTHLVRAEQRDGEDLVRARARPPGRPGARLEHRLVRASTCIRCSGRRRCGSGRKTGEPAPARSGAEGRGGLGPGQPGVRAPGRGGSADPFGHAAAGRAEKAEDADRDRGGPPGARRTALRGSAPGRSCSGADARRATASATSLALASAASEQLDSSLDQSLLLALAANQTKDNAQARSAMTLALETARASGFDAILASPDCDRVVSVASAADGKTLAVGCDNGKTLLWDVAAEAMRGAPLASRRLRQPSSVSRSPARRSRSAATTGTRCCGMSRPRPRAARPSPTPPATASTASRSLPPPTGSRSAAATGRRWCGVSGPRHAQRDRRQPRLQPRRQRRVRRQDARGRLRQREDAAVG